MKLMDKWIFELRRVWHVLGNRANHKNNFKGEILVKKKLVSTFIVLFLSIGLLIPQSAIALESSSATSDYLQSIIDMVKDQYNGDVSDKELVEGALKGIFSSMDPYTEYFTIEDANSFVSTIEGIYEGVGVLISIVNEQFIITKVFPDSPAESAGLLAGDKIINIDGVDIAGLTIEEISNRIKGEIGSKVNIAISRIGKEKALNIEVTRGQISVSPISYEVINNIGYIKIEIFNSNTSKYLTQALKDMDKRKISKIVLDLRNNPGGELIQAVETARNFVPNGVITKVDYKSESEDDTIYYSYLPTKKYTISVLVNGLSASASEIVAGAIQDTKSGILIGEKTFGKAKVQSMIPILTPQAFAKYKTQVGEKLVNAYDLYVKYHVMPLDEEILGYSKITTGEYRTPNGRMIDNKGLIPDIIIPATEPVNGIYPSSVQKLMKVAKYGLNSEGVDIYNAEMILTLCGYNIDEPDYLLDEKTFNVIAEFQRQNGLYPYGVLDFTTQQLLNDTLLKKTLEIDKQLAKAISVLIGQ